MRLLFVWGWAMFLVFSGCSPSFGPMYRDYAVGGGARTGASADQGDVIDMETPGEAERISSEEVRERVVMALQSAGWEEEASVVPTVVRTNERRMNHRIFYKTTAFLEVLPVGDNYVRVLIHPYRDHLIGARSKLPYLPQNVRNRIVPPLTRALEEQGFTVAKPPMPTGS